MKCPCCGKEMVMDAHTKIDRFMCYDCGYVEGRPVPAAVCKSAYRHKLFANGLGFGKSRLASSHH